MQTCYVPHSASNLTRVRLVPQAKLAVQWLGHEAHQLPLPTAEECVEQHLHCLKCLQGLVKLWTGNFTFSFMYKCQFLFHKETTVIFSEEEGVH